MRWYSYVFKFCALELTKGKYCTNFKRALFVFGNLVIIPTVCSQSIWIYLPIKYQSR